MLETRRRGIPMLLLNGRMSARSFRALAARAGADRGRCSARFELCLAQDAAAGRAAARSSAPARCASVGDLKAAAAPLPVDDGGARGAGRRRSATGRSGSPPAPMTGEEEHRGRRPSRARARRIAASSPSSRRAIRRAATRSRRCSRRAACASRGARAARRSTRRRPTSISPTRWASSGLFYRLAGIAFIGGSLARMGGHNPLEAALLDCAILHGPDMSNCAAIAARARDARGAAEIVDRRAEASPPRSAAAARRPGRARRARRAPPPASPPAQLAHVLDAVMERLAPWLDRLAPR